MKDIQRILLVALVSLAGRPLVGASCAPLPPGVISWWQAEGNGRDSVGGNHGTLSGSAGFTNGMVGQGFLFNGSSGGVNLGDVPAFNFAPDSSFSIEAWFKSFGPTSGGNDSQFIVSLNYGCGNTAQNLFLRNSDAVVRFQVRDASGNANQARTLAVSSNEFHHVVGVREVNGTNRTLRIYLDGVVADIQPDLSTGILSTNAPDWIGRRNTCGTDDVFNGIIDEVAVYDRALSDAEIQGIYRAGSAGKCLPSSCVPVPPGAVALWRAEGNGSDSISTNHGTLTGSAGFTNGMVGQGFLFNGSSGGVNLGDVPAFNFAPDGSFSIEAWFNSFGPSGGANDAQIITSFNYACSNTSQTLSLANSGTGYGVINFQVRDASGREGRARTPAVSSNAFHHVVGVREVSGTNRTLRIYLDGVLADVQPDLSTGILSTNAPDWIGRRNTCGTDDVFNGIIDEVTVYHRALSATEVQGIYLAGSAGKCIPSSCVPVPQGVISWWQAEGNGIDSVGGNHGKLTGTVSFTNGMVGQGILLNGLDGGVDLGDVPAFNFAPDSSFSIEAWFNSFGPTSGGNDGQMIVSLNYDCRFNGQTAQNLFMRNSDGVVRFQVRDANSNENQARTTPVSYNAFHHVVGVREISGTNRTLRVYLDGALADVQPDLSTGILSTNVPDWIGRRNTCGTDDVFNGIIDEVAVYDRALSATEVQGIYLAGSAGKCPAFLSGNVRPNGPNLVISWPSSLAGWLLQQNTNINSKANWRVVTGGIQDNGTNKTAIISTLSGNGFYRLLKP